MIKLPPSTQRTPPASARQIAEAEKLLETSIPNEMRALYAVSNGVATGSGMVIYPAEDLVERNSTLEVRRYARGYLAVGDDSGGRALLLPKDGNGVWVDMGSMDPSLGEPLMMPFLAWLEAGLPEPEPDVNEPPAFVDVYLERVPAGGLQALVALKTGLSLEISPKELKEALSKVPARLQRGVPYGKTAVRCRRINGTLKCLGLRAVDDPDTKVPL